MSGCNVDIGSVVYAGVGVDTVACVVDVNVWLSFAVFVVDTAIAQGVITYIDDNVAYMVVVVVAAVIVVPSDVVGVIGIWCCCCRCYRCAGCVCC